MNTQQQIKEIFNKYAEENNFSGAALVKKGDETLFHDAYGDAHKGFKVKNTITTKFDTASITKLFTAVGILQLIDKNLISFEDKVLDILDIKDTTISKEVNIYHLLTHTSGIGDDADEEAGEEYEDIWREKPNYSVRETVDFLPQFIHKEHNFEPGKGCRYNNVAFVLLGLVIEKISGQKYREYIKEHVFKKIGMKNSGFYSMDGVNENVAEGYAEICNEKDEVIGWRKNIYSYPPMGSPDGGAHTIVEDLDLFVRELYNGRVLSKAMTEDLFTPKVVHTKYEKITAMMGYAYEFILGNDNNEVIYITKDGCNAGVACKFNYYPSIDTTLVVLANQDCNVWALAREVQEILIGKINFRLDSYNGGVFMQIEQLTTERMALFINYCKKYRDELSDEYILDAHLDKFQADEENPTYILLDDKNDIFGVVSLIIDSYHKEGKIGRFRIFHSSMPEKKCYELMFKKILKHTEGLNEIFLYIKEDDIKRAEILEMLNFKKQGYSFTLIRDDIEITEPEFPEGFELRTFKPSRDEADWCQVRNIGFPDDIPRTPENVCLYWEEDPDSYLEGGMLILYYNNKPVGTIRSSKEMENGEPYNFISVVCVNPEYRGRGFAKNMLRAALRLGKNKGLEKAMLCVDPDNPNAIDLYIKEGFKKLSGAVAFSYNLTTY